MSRVLHSPEKVSEALRQKVQAVVDQLGYVPNRAARHLASARSQTILVLIPSLTNTVFIDTLAGIESVLQPLGYQMLIGNTHYHADEEQQLLRAYMAHSPDGLLLTGLSQSDEIKQLIARYQIPVVHMMDLTDDGRDCVGFSQEDAGRVMTEHLLQRGRRKVAFLGAQLDERVMKRLAGYRQALQQANCYTPIREMLNPRPSTMQMGADMLDELMATQPDCDAVFCCNDDLAIGLIARCQQRGIAVPGQLAVGGFNDLAPAAWTTPSLTTITTPRFDIGRIAAQQLLDRINGVAPTTARLDLGFALQHRQSS